MANIDEYIKQIQQAQYGEEVRGSIVSALKKVNDDNNSYVAIKKEVVAAKDTVEEKAEIFDEKANAAKETLTALQVSTQIANEAKSSLNNIISSAISTQKELEQVVLETGEVIARVDNAKSNLDKSITSAGKAELNLQRQIETSNQIKNQLDVSNNTAIELKKNLDVAINEANTAKVKLVEAINNAGNAALENIKTVQNTATQAVETAKVEAVKTLQTEGTIQTGKVTDEGAKQVQAIQSTGTAETKKVTDEGTKQVTLVKTEGEKHLAAVQIAAQEIITDREQINTNKEGVAQLKEDLSELSEDIAGLKQNGTGGSGVTTEQANSLWAIIQKTAFTEALTEEEKTAFKVSWGIESGGEAEPDEPTEPDNPEVTLSSISATYTGGSVAVGTAVTSLTGITVKATYSDGSTKTITGYTLSGTIAEGSNTITVSYGGKTTTFTVTGIAEEIEYTELSNSADSWEVGGIQPQGTKSTNTARLRTIATLSDDVKKISVDDGYSYILVAYANEQTEMPSSTDTVLLTGKGFYNPNGIAGDVSTNAFLVANGVYFNGELVISEVRANINSMYNNTMGDTAHFRILLKNNDDATLTADDGLHIHLWG